jgi:hypothetical protein
VAFHLLHALIDMVAAVAVAGLLSKPTSCEFGAIVICEQ